MPDYAMHNGGTVVNVIVAESQEIAEKVTGLNAVETSGVPWIGWTLVNGEWVAPLEPEPEPEPAPVTE